MTRPSDIVLNESDDHVLGAERARYAQVLADLAELEEALVHSEEEIAHTEYLDETRHDAYDALPLL